ncbi:MAG: hypothetical protein K2X28_04665 [Alphaproteobacteria bacterium]|nr:hypothetical protein [Alphaproteobacteria bacterium]
MKLKTFGILLSLSAACSSTTHAMITDKEDRLAALLKQRQATIEKGREIQAAQTKLHEDSKRSLEEIKEAQRRITAERDCLKAESSRLMDAVLNGTISLEDAEHKLSQLERKAQAK